MTVVGRKFAVLRKQHQHLGEKRRKREWAEEAAGLQCSPSKELSQLPEGTLKLGSLQSYPSWDKVLGWES